ncbi:MerR family transcriptional regulator [Deinococcus sp.]|uniref:MerR family transcriptional regulator n=1 Tax=Deinococcus sp. TaxID=47478 RepID=UPI0025C22416|nr:MerR family transcriptional regulator [Deinococcus sp.]
MKIGEFAARSGISARLLRYYEEQQLLLPRRGENGYRQYSADMLRSAAQIRALLDAGMPTTIIRDILPCLSATEDIYLQKLSPETRLRLEQERDRISARIVCLARNRDAIDAYLSSVPLT